MGGTYRQTDDYFLSNLEISEQNELFIGVWAQRHRRYLKEHHRVHYYNFLTSGTLSSYLAEVESQAQTMFDEIVKRLSEKENVNEKLKATDSCKWKNSTINKILTQQEYCGDVINFKTYSRSYKNKNRFENDRENWVAFENANEPIIDRDTFNRVQQRRGKTHNKKRKDGERNMFSGLLVCSDCGSNLHFHFNQGNRSIQYFNCSNNSRNRTCPTTHYIRTDFLEQVVLKDINRLIAFTNQYKDELVRILEENSGKEYKSQPKSIENGIEKLTERNN